MQPKWVLLNNDVDKQWSGWQQGPEAQSRCLSQQCGVMMGSSPLWVKVVWSTAGFSGTKQDSVSSDFCIITEGSVQPSLVLKKKAGFSVE